MTQTHSLTLLGLTLVAITWAWTANGLQRPVIEVGPDVQVSFAPPDRPQVEPFLAIDPHNSDRLVAASILSRSSGSLIDRVLVYTSDDGGASWTPASLEAREDGAHCLGDPWLVWSRSGTVYLSCLAEVRDEFGREPYVVFVQRSTDAGRSWSVPVQVPYDRRSTFDHPVLIQLGRSDEGDHLAVVATHSIVDGSGLSVSRSEDGGRHFDTARIYLPGEGNHNLGSAVGLGNDQVLYTYFTMAQRRPFWSVREPARDGAPAQSPIADHISPFGFPMLALDRSGGEHAGRVYNVWTHANEAGGLDIALSSSDDDGITWSRPVTINGSANSSTSRFHPQVVVSDEGLVAVAWTDRRLDPSNQCSDVFFTASTDGGVTFLPDVRVTQETACNQTAANGAAGTRWRSGGGDYIGLAAAVNSRFHLAWSDSRTGVFQVWTSVVQVSSGLTLKTAACPPSCPAVRHAIPRLANAYLDAPGACIELSESGSP